MFLIEDAFFSSHVQKCSDKCLFLQGGGVLPDPPMPLSVNIQPQNWVSLHFHAQFLVSVRYSCELLRRQSQVGVNLASTRFVSSFVAKSTELQFTRVLYFYFRILSCVEARQRGTSLRRWSCIFQATPKFASVCWIPDSVAVVRSLLLLPVCVEIYMYIFYFGVDGRSGDTREYLVQRCCWSLQSRSWPTFESWECVGRWWNRLFRRTIQLSLSPRPPRVLRLRLTRIFTRLVIGETWTFLSSVICSLLFVSGYKFYMCGDRMGPNAAC